MFQNSYQGGTHVDIYDAKVNKDKEKTYANLYRMTTQQGFSKVFDKDIKGYIYSIDGHSTKMRFPKDDKVDLCIVQHFLVFQIYLPFGSPWNLEIGIADTSRVNRRINLVSALNKIETKYFHVKVPNDIIKRGVWLNLSIDVNSFMDAWKGQTFRSIDSITIGSTCRLRRVFSMKNPLFEFTPQDDLQEQHDSQMPTYSQQKQEDIPKNFAFPPGFHYMNQLINFQKIIDNVDPKYLENISETIDKSHLHQQSTVQKQMIKNSSNATLSKSIATKSIKNNINRSNLKQNTEMSQDFFDKNNIPTKNSYARLEKSPLSIQSSQQYNNSKFTSPQRDNSASNSKNLDEESKSDINFLKSKEYLDPKEGIKQQIKNNQQNNSQKGGAHSIQSNSQQKLNKMMVSPKNSSLKSPVGSKVELAQSSNSRQTTQNSQRQQATQKKQPIQSQNNNPWYVNQNKGNLQQFENKNQENEDIEEYEEIEEDLDAENYDKYEMNENLPQTLNKKDSKTINSQTSKNNYQNGDQKLNSNKVTQNQEKTTQKKQGQPLQIEQKRHVKSANNFANKISLLDPKKTKEENKDVQKKQNNPSQQIGFDQDCLDNNNALNSMNTDLDEESYFQLTQKFNTISDPNQFRDIFASSNSKFKSQIEDSYGNQAEIDEFDEKEIEEDINTENPSGIKKSKITNNNSQVKSKNNKGRELNKQNTVESQKLQTKREVSNQDDSTENVAKQNFEDSLDGPYIQKNLNNGNDNDQEEQNYQYYSGIKDDQGNTSPFNNNIYENHLNKFINNSQRPFTPPFQSVVTLQGSQIAKRNSQGVVIQNQSAEYSDKSYLSNKMKKQINDQDDSEQLEVIYDPVLNCYYDPNTKEYYELKS